MHFIQAFHVLIPNKHSNSIVFFTLLWRYSGDESITQCHRIHPTLTLDPFHKRGTERSTRSIWLLPRCLMRYKLAHNYLYKFELIWRSLLILLMVKMYMLLLCPRSMSKVGDNMWVIYVRLWKPRRYSRPIHTCVHSWRHDAKFYSLFFLQAKRWNVQP